MLEKNLGNKKAMKEEKLNIEPVEKNKKSKCKIKYYSPGNLHLNGYKQREKSNRNVC